MKALNKKRCSFFCVDLAVHINRAELCAAATTLLTRHNEAMQQPIPDAHRYVALALPDVDADGKKKKNAKKKSKVPPVSHF